MLLTINYKLASAGTGLKGIMAVFVSAPEKMYSENKLFRRRRIVRFHYVCVPPLLLLLCEGIIHQQANDLSILKW